MIEVIFSEIIRFIIKTVLAFLGALLKYPFVFRKKSFAAVMDEYWTPGIGILMVLGGLIVFFVIR